MLNLHPIDPDHDSHSTSASGISHIAATWAAVFAAMKSSMPEWRSGRWAPSPPLSPPGCRGFAAPYGPSADGKGWRIADERVGGVTFRRARVNSREKVAKRTLGGVEGHHQSPRTGAAHCRPTHSPVFQAAAGPRRHECRSGGSCVSDPPRWSPSLSTPSVALRSAATRSCVAGRCIDIEVPV